MDPNAYLHDVSKLDAKVLHIFDNIQRYGFTDAIIAGGFIRDSLFKIPYKDVDIYLSDEYRHKFTSIHRNMNIFQAINLCGLNAWTNVSVSVNAPGKTYYYADDLNLLSHVINVDIIDKKMEKDRISSSWRSSKDRISLQLIFVKCNPEKYVEKCFDIGISKCYYNGTNRIFLSDCLKDIREKTLTICNPHITEDTFRRIRYGYVPRLLEKYPSFKLKISDELIQKGFKL